MNRNGDPELLVRQEEPFNAEPPLHRLTERFLTPNSRFFVRNHAPVPRIEPESYRLKVGGLVERELALSMEELREEFDPVSVTATLQCAGNRRDELMSVRAIPGQVRWGAGAIGTARWKGVPLRRVLSRAGVTASEARHVAFTGLDRVPNGDGTFGFGGSIPLERAMRPDVLLAYEMNGEPLPPDHGYPLRAVVPGYIGARSVKWLGEVRVRADPSDNHFQPRAYRLFPPHVTAETVRWDRGLSLGELPVNAVITEPRPGARIARERARATVRGYAMSGGSRTVERVDVSPDGGESWHTAEFTACEGEPGVWRLWRADLDLDRGSRELAVRAWDSSAGTQPENVAPIWNFGGYINNAWHRVTVHVGGSGEGA